MSDDTPPAYSWVPLSVGRGSDYASATVYRSSDHEFPSAARISALAESLYEDNRPSLEVMRRAPVSRWRELDSDTKGLWIMIARSAWTRGAR